MKTTITVLFCATFLLGCGQQKPDPKIAELESRIADLQSNETKEIHWEYKVDIADFSTVQDAVAVAKNNLADARHDLAVAKINEQIAENRINSDAVDSSNIDATVELDLKKDDIEDEREEGIRTNLLAGLNSPSDWELVSATVLPSNQKKILLIFKRPIK
jgi:hypothetical protein